MSTATARPAPLIRQSGDKLLVIVQSQRLAVSLRPNRSDSRRSSGSPHSLATGKRFWLS
jgi:hypothetical protein